MNVYELTLKVYCLQDIESKNALEKIASLIDKSFLEDEELKELHKSNQFKFYCFNSLFPLEIDKTYKKGKVYSIIIRTLSEKIKDHFMKVLHNQGTDFLKALTIECRSLKKRSIEKIYTVSPAVAKFENGYWKTNESVDTFERRIIGNLIKKYNKYNNVKIDEDVDIFTIITIDNKKPIATNLKNKTLLGDKLTLYVAENETAQNLAYFALGSGLLELNSRGMGFLNYSYFR